MPSPSDSVKSNYSFFHATSKILTRETYTLPYQSGYKSGHIVSTMEIISKNLPNAGSSTILDTWITNNPGIIKKYTKYPLTPVVGTSNELWYINDNGKWIKPFLLPETVADPITNAKSFGYNPTLYTESELTILTNAGMWWIDPYQGIIKFGDGYNPADMVPSWGIPKITCYTYIGETLYDQLQNLPKIKSFKYTSITPSVQHEIIHNLNSMDIDISVYVQDSYTNNWTKDIVGININDENKITINLTESSNIRVIIQLIN